jgi:hypothetical protein
MNSVEMITRENIDTFKIVAPSLAETYKIAFAGDPWYEVSRCGSKQCAGSFKTQEADENCATCGTALVPAYDSDELVSGWQAIIEEEDAVVELTRDQLERPVCVTIARPTTQEELWRRKYLGITAMSRWIDEQLPSKFVWIEDTFANRKISPTGNLKNRGATLGRIAARYGGLQIATRTLQPAIIRATLRDVGPNTTMYVGSEGIGNDIAGSVRFRGNVPDRRTVLVIEGGDQ